MELTKLHDAAAAICDPTPAVEPPKPEAKRFMKMDESGHWALVGEGLHRLGILDEEGTIPIDLTSLRSNE